MDDTLTVKGDLVITLTSQDNTTKTYYAKNLVTTAGKQWMIGRLSNTNPPPQMSHMGVGQGTTTQTVADTALQSQLARVTATQTLIGNQIQFSAGYPAGTATGIITEAGVFNSATAGTLFCRTVFDPVYKNPTDILNITWTVTLV